MHAGTHPPMLPVLQDLIHAVLVNFGRMNAVNHWWDCRLRGRACRLPAALISRAGASSALSSSEHCRAPLGCRSSWHQALQ